MSLLDDPFAERLGTQYVIQIYIRKADRWADYDIVHDAEESGALASIITTLVRFRKEDANTKFRLITRHIYAKDVIWEEGSDIERAAIKNITQPRTRITDSRRSGRNSTFVCGCPGCR